MVCPAARTDRRLRGNCPAAMAGGRADGHFLLVPTRHSCRIFHKSSKSTTTLLSTMLLSERNVRERAHSVAMREQKKKKYAYTQIHLRACVCVFIRECVCVFIRVFLCTRRKHVRACVCVRRTGKVFRAVRRVATQRRRVGGGKEMDRVICETRTFVISSDRRARTNMNYYHFCEEWQDGRGRRVRGGAPGQNEISSSCTRRPRTAGTRNGGGGGPDVRVTHYAAAP